ncbi:MAG: PLDc_N domain-containing protein [Pseudonocardiaceae bacterium]|nr:MAG: PLDc_N domain-containing protein [Pseudonocardiaceae bacterium]
MPRTLEVVTREVVRARTDRSPARRAAITVAAALQLGLLAAALQDVLRRPADQLTAPKAVWAAVCFVNVVGPLSYFAFGRRR